MQDDIQLIRAALASDDPRENMPLGAVMRLLARLEAAERLLALARPFIERARHEAEARHDDPTGDLYMEASMYAIMQEADAVLAAMKAAP